MNISLINVCIGQKKQIILYYNKVDIKVLMSYW
jgi:hypothetical protein